ncbi:MAG: hypothetical protein NT166_06295 [Candidatus Aminicenantes bacterium]|nr:hypothetical protein [Candidatus Aminicenantes bacterium]
MKRKNKCLIVGYMFFIFFTALDAAEIYYHWVDDSNVMLWKGDDPNWITATLERGEWKLDQEEEKKAEWEKFMSAKYSQSEYIKKFITNVSPAKNKDFLEAFLCYLREVCPDDKMTALKYPDALIYIQPISNEPSNDRFKLIVMNKTELFSWAVNLKWDQNTDPFRKNFAANLFKAINNKDELNVIFKNDIKDANMLNEQDFWETWISQMVNSNKPMNYIYETKDNEKYWLFVEKISIIDMEKRLRPQPVKPEIKEKKEIQTVTEPIPWRSKFIFGFLGFVLGIITFLIGPRVIQLFRNKCAQTDNTENGGGNKREEPPKKDKWNLLRKWRKRNEDKTHCKSLSDFINKTKSSNQFIIDEIMKLPNEIRNALPLESEVNKKRVEIGKKVEEIYNKSEKDTNIECWFNDFILSAEQNKLIIKDLQNRENKLDENKKFIEFGKALEAKYQIEKTPEDIDIVNWLEKKINQLKDCEIKIKELEKNVDTLNKNGKYVELGRYLEKAHKDSYESQEQGNENIWLDNILQSFKELKRKVKCVEDQVGNWEYVEKYIRLGRCLENRHKQWEDPQINKLSEMWLNQILSSLKTYENKFDGLQKQINTLTNEKDLLNLVQEKIRLEMVKMADNKEKEKLEDAWQATKEKIDKDNKTIGELNQSVLDKDKELNNFGKKMEEIKKYSDNIKKIIPYLWQGQMEIFNNLKEDRPEITSMLSFLIYYSLFHFYEASVENMISKKEGDEEKNVRSKMDFMLANLIDISKKMQNRIPLFGEMPFNGFKFSYGEIVRHLSPLPETLTFSKTETLHRNQALFETLVSRLMTISNRKLNLSPFYYVDKVGEVYKAG